MARLGRGHVRAFGAVGVVLLVAHSLPLGTAVDVACLTAIAIGSCAAMLVGQWLNRPRQPWPWRLIAAAAIVFLIGMTARHSLADLGEAGPYLANGFTLGGYAILIIGLSLMLRGRGALGRHALIDGVIIGVGAALVAAELFAMPAAGIRTRPPAVSLLEASYPFLDVVLLMLLLNLAFSTAVRLFSFRLITLSLVAMLIGDVGYAWLGAHGTVVGPPLLDVPFMISYLAFGAAALHPSMVGFSGIVARPVQAWSWPRLALIIPSLLSPSLLSFLTRPSPADRIAMVAATTGLITLLFLRAVSAVRGFARAQEDLREQATHDALTGLPNRTALGGHVEILVSRPTGGPVWLLHLDLDEFRLINDHWGHDTGDALLREVARRLQDFVGDRYFAARIGGDEFVVVGRGDGDLPRQAAAIQDLLAVPVQLPELELVVSASIGIAVATGHETAEALLRDADTALYRAKADGRNRWTMFQETMRQTVRQRVETEVQLRRAIGQGELWVAYQPMLDPRTQLPVGAEALVRWRHPERGPVLPGEFIPVAEETGLISQIGGWVLDESLRQLASWRDDGVLPDGFTVSVNLSARQLRDPDLRLTIVQALRRHGLSADRLVVEITESVMMDDAERARQVLTDLHAAGLRLSVDDFGTGYSSLSYLSRFPVGEVKIDRSFVAGLGSDGGAEAIVNAVVAMARALRLDVVAEGVETAEQRQALCLLQIDRAQGWLWGAAVSGEEFAARHLTPQPSPV